MIAVLLVGRAAGAQAQPSGAASPVAADDSYQEARAHYEKGMKLFDAGDYREAYDEFRKSLALKKRKAAMAQAASCLRQLGRYDEALDQYEEVLREYPNLPAKFGADVAIAIAELSRLVGTLELAGDTPAGGALFVDDQLRGKLPLSGPLRVAVGTHRIRVEKDGFEPISAVVDVQAGQKSVAELRASARKGRLSVNERHNWVLAVELDGKEVGVTPWEGLVEPGEHQVRLRGFVGLDALAECAAPEAGAVGTAAAQDGAKMASPVETAVVRPFEVTRVTPGAEEQDASLRIESTPSGARLTIDGKAVGPTPWEGRLPLGEHAIEVSAGGFVPSRQPVQLVRRKQRELSVVLEREPDREAEQRAARNVKIGVGLAYGVGAVGLGMFAVAGGLALDKVNGLKASCPNQQCPSTETENLNDVSTLGTVSTVGVVVAGLGAAAGTAVLLLTRPEEGKRPAGPSVSASVGLGGFGINGRF
ncbi:PEGA domain-containing protein [Sorangium cellulosum]|nr:PEGA domain-containing protein [Sorangium cellulosum]